MQLDLTKCWKDGRAPDPKLDADDIEREGALIAFQKKVCAVLVEWLPLAPVFAQNKPGVLVYEDKRTVASEVATALQAVGISMVVGLKSAVRSSGLKNAITFSPLTFTVSIAEAPITNRGQRGTGITCTRCAELVILALSGLTLANGVVQLSNVSSGGDDGDLQMLTLAFNCALVVTPPENLLME